VCAWRRLDFISLTVSIRLFFMLLNPKFIIAFVLPYFRRYEMGTVISCARHPISKLLSIHIEINLFSLLDFLFFLLFNLFEFLFH
jgi:hypothetical protein